MKRVSRLSIVLPLLIMLTVSGLASADLNQYVDIEVTPTYHFSGEAAQIVWADGKPRLKYSITNVSSSPVPALKVSLSVYDSRGYLRGRQRWVLQEPVSEWSSKTGTVPIKADLKDAATIKVEFAAITNQQVPGCDTDKFCGICSKEARETCGAGKVQSVECLVGTSCSCTYNCGGPGPVLP